MYVTLKIGRFKLAAATKDEYLIPPDEYLLCKKGFRFQIGNYIFNKSPPQEQPCLSKKAPAKKRSVKTSPPKSKVASRSSKPSPSPTPSKKKPVAKKAKSNAKTVK